MSDQPTLPTAQQLQDRIDAYHVGGPSEQALWDATHPLHITAIRARDSAFDLVNGRFSDDPEAA